MAIEIIVYFVALLYGAMAIKDESTREIISQKIYKTAGITLVLAKNIIDYIIFWGAITLFIVLLIVNSTGGFTTGIIKYTIPLIFGVAVVSNIKTRKPLLVTAINAGTFVMSVLILYIPVNITGITKELLIVATFMAAIMSLIWGSVISSLDKITTKIKDRVDLFANKINEKTEIRNYLANIFIPDILDELLLLPPKTLVEIVDGVVSSLSKIAKGMATISLALLVTAYIVVFLPPSIYLFAALAGLVIIGLTQYHLGNKGTFLDHSKRVIGAIVLINILFWGVDSIPTTSVWLKRNIEASLAPKQGELQKGWVIYPEKDGRPDFAQRVVLEKNIGVFFTKIEKYKKDSQVYYRVMIPSNKDFELVNPIIIWASELPAERGHSFGMIRWALNFTDLKRQNDGGEIIKSTPPSSQQSPAQTAPRAIQQAQVTGQTTGRQQTTNEIILVPGTRVFKNKIDSPEFGISEAWEYRNETKAVLTGKKSRAVISGKEVNLVQINIPKNEFLDDGFGWIIKD